MRWGFSKGKNRGCASADEEARDGSGGAGDMKMSEMKCAMERLDVGRTSKQEG